MWKYTAPEIAEIVVGSLLVAAGLIIYVILEKKGKAHIITDVATPEILPVKLIILSAAKGSALFFKKGHSTKEAVFEAMLFNLTYSVRSLKQKLPNLYDRFDEDLTGELYKYVIRVNIKNNIPGNFRLFVLQRFQLNGEQIDSLDGYYKKGFIPLTKVVYNLYENPLTSESHDSRDMAAIMTLTLKLKEVYEYLDSCISEIITGIKSPPRSSH